MTLSVSPKPESAESTSLELQEKEDGIAASPDVTTTVFVGQKPVLKNWKIFREGGAQGDEDTLHLDDKPLFANPARRLSERQVSFKRPDSPFWLQVGQAVAVFVTVAWLTYASIYILALPNGVRSILSSPLTLGGVLASVLAPVAMLWLCIATWQRRSDAHLYAQALRSELRGLFFPTENQANLIGEDIRALMQQATEMSASSRAAIKAIQRARTGLRSEIRDFAGVSQKAEFHIDRLADALGKRAEELLSLTETIESQSESISAKAQRGVSQWENVSAEISELGEEIDGIFAKGTEKLTGASETTLARIGDVVGKIDSVHIQLDSQADKLQSVAASINTGTTKLGESLTGAQKISAAVEGVMDVMTASMGKVEQTATTFFDRTGDIEQKLESRAAALKDSADKLLESTDSLQGIGDLATNKLGEALSMAISGAETITSAVRRSKEMMDKAVSEATTQIEQTSRTADDKLARLMEEARTNRDHLSALINQIEEQQAEFAKSAKGIEESRDHVVSAADKAISGLNDAASRMVIRSEEPLKLIQSSIDRLEQHTATLDDKLSVRVVEVEQQTGKLKDIAATVAENLTSGLENISLTTTHVSEQARSISDEVTGQRDILNIIVADLQDKTKVVSGLLQEQGQYLSTSLENAESKISELGQVFFEKSDALIDKVAEVSEKVESHERRLSDAVLSVDRKSLEIEQSVDRQIGKMEQLSVSIAPFASEVILEAERISSRYDDLKHSYLNATDTATACLMDLGDKLETRIEKLGNETLETSKVFLTVTEDISVAMENIKRASESAHDNISRVQGGMKSQVDELQSVATRVQETVGTLQGNLTSYAGDLAESVGKAVSDLEFATDKFGQTSIALGDRAESLTSRVLDATRQYTEESHRMSMLGEQAIHKSARIVAVIQEEADKLVNSARSSLIELQKSGDTLSIRAREVEEYLKSSLEHAKTYSEELKEQSSQIGSYSAEVVDQIAAATVRLTSKVMDVKEVGSNIADDIEASRQRLSDESARLSNLSRKTVEAADEVVGVFGKHSTLLRQEADDLVKQANQIRDGQMRLEREAFLTSSKFIIESLYSLAVDVSRHLEGDLDMRILRAYQKGDIAAYAHHLVEFVPRIPLERSQRKFIEDGEFRTYVLRFIRQYEELLEQAQANDYADLLSSVFSTSDVGKLYKLLCEMAGRSLKEH